MMSEDDGAAGTIDQQQDEPLEDTRSITTSTFETTTLPPYQLTS